MALYVKEKNSITRDLEEKKFLRKPYWPIEIEANLGSNRTIQIYSSVG